MDNNAIVIAGPEGTIRFWNPAAEAAFGYAARDAIGKTLDLIVPPEFQEVHWIGFRRAIASGVAEAEGQISPFPVRMAGGEIATWPARLSLMREPEGQVIAAMVVFARYPSD